MDIDIDFGNRDAILKHIRYVDASMMRQDKVVKHPTGVYVTDIPVDPFLNVASIDHKQAESMGYVKLDFLNVNVYEQVRNTEHLETLMSTPPMWEMLKYREFVESVIHINGQYDIMQKMPEPIDSVETMAMFLAIIRPAKRHLIGKKWQEVEKEIWLPSSDGSYGYKKAHAVSYSMLVIVHMNLLCGV